MKALPREFDTIPLFLQDGGDVERDPDLVADQQIATSKRLVEFHIEVLAVQKSLDLRSGALIAPWIGIGALQDEVQFDLTSDAVHGEVAPDARGVIVDRLDPRGLKGDLGKRIDIEEVRGAQVRVALLFAGVDRRDFDTSARLRAPCVFSHLHGSLKISEPTTNVRNPHVLDGELNARVRWINMPRAGRNQRCCACRSQDPPPQKKRNREPCTTCPANEHHARLTGHSTPACECGQRIRDGDRVLSIAQSEWFGRATRIQRPSPNQRAGWSAASTFTRSAIVSRLGEAFA